MGAVSWWHWLIVLVVIGVFAAAAAVGGVVLVVKASSAKRPQSGPVPGWYPDPRNCARYRYWDGLRWTEHESTGT
ncbi:DUF2510 domain-containing protein [Gordonia sp. NPDC003376]